MLRDLLKHSCFDPEHHDLIFIDYFDPESVVYSYSNIYTCETYVVILTHTHYIILILYYNEDLFQVTFFRTINQHLFRSLPTPSHS